LEETTRVAQEYMKNVLLPPADNPNGQGSANTAAWDLFFVKPGKSHQRRLDEHIQGPIRFDLA